MSQLTNLPVVGLDLSLSATGIATPNGCDTIKIKPTPGTTEYGRLTLICATIMARVNDTNPVLVVVEGPSYNSRTGKQHERAGLFWLVYDQLTRQQYKIAVAPPTTVKKYATGKGNADKDAVLIAVMSRLPIPVANNNEADAAVLMAMGLDQLGSPLTRMPALHRAALDAVDWPTPQKRTA